MQWPCLDFSTVCARVRRGISAYERGPAFRAELRIGFGARTAFLANGRVSSAHDSQRLGGVSRFERFVIGIGDLSGLPIELELTQSIDGGYLARTRVLGFPLRYRDIRTKKRIKDEAERRYGERRPNQKRGHASRRTAASRAASSPSVASIAGLDTGAVVTVRDFQRCNNAATITAPVPSAMKGMV